jgi:hypothetical protein
MINDQLGSVPGQWMSLIADWTIGSHLTLNGSLHTYGIQSPISVGDNVEFDNTVFHIDSIVHSCRQEAGSGRKNWTTQLALTNGMRADIQALDSTTADAIDRYPIYAGFEPEDNRGFDPGLTLEGRRTTGGSSQHSNISDEDRAHERETAASQLDPQTQDDSTAPKKQAKRRKRK